VAQLRGQSARQEEALASLTSQLQVLQRHVFGKRSEKMPTPAEEIGSRVDAATALSNRRERAAKKAELPTIEVRHEVPTEKRVCPKCGRRDLKPLGAGKKTVLYEFIPARLERHVHVQETLACPCGEGIVTADGPPKVVDKGHYGPSFVAHVVTAKCADSIPLYRLSKSLGRAGIPVNRSTLIDLFHRAAELCAPIVARLLVRIAEHDVVQADETTLRVQEKVKTRTAWLWTFLAVGDEPLIAYRFSSNRSGETPEEVLGDTAGALVVDGFTGYNPVTKPQGRQRGGCWAHVRRKFFDAKSSAPDESRAAMELILELFRIEQEARQRGIAGTPSHLALRAQESRPTLDAIKAWLDEQAPKHPPKSPIAGAIGYALGQWKELTLFLTDARIPIHNNASEAALRVAALGRKNYLFVGHDEAGRNLAGLYSLVATCDANGVNPQAYLADVLLRVQTHPASRIDELLPNEWKKRQLDSS
jgi:transposase